MTYEEKIEDIGFSKVAIKVLLKEFEEFEKYTILYEEDLYEFQESILSLQTADFIFQNCDDLDVRCHNSDIVKNIFRQLNELAEYKRFKKLH
jgi:hypothetical protein